MRKGVVIKQFPVSDAVLLEYSLRGEWPLDDTAPNTNVPSELPRKYELTDIQENM